MAEVVACIIRQEPYLTQEIPVVRVAGVLVVLWVLLQVDLEGWLPVVRQLESWVLKDTQVAQAGTIEELRRPEMEVVVEVAEPVLLVGPVVLLPVVAELVGVAYHHQLLAAQFIMQVVGVVV